MSESREIQTLRGMAWERAKGELRSLLYTFWDRNKMFTLVDKEVEKFIKTMEDEVGL